MMIDREKVIKGLECCNESEYWCEDCPYFEHDGDDEICDIEVLLNDVRTLLKAQEPVKPIVAHNVGPGWWYSCGACKMLVESGDKYCRHCGRELKWE